MGEGEKRSAQEKREEAAQRKAEREVKRVEKEKEKAHKQALNAVSKGMKRENWMEYMTICLDHSLANDKGGVELLTTLQLEGLQCKASTQPLPGAVSFTRTVLTADNGDVIRDEVAEPTVILVQQAEALTAHIANNTLLTYATQAKSILGQAPTLLVVGLDKVMKSKKKNAVTRLQWEEEMLVLQFQFKMSAYYIETTGELSEHLRMLCKAVAERPHKLDKELYIECGKDSVSVGKDGTGLLKVWTKQLQDIRHISEAIANAVTTQYPSPRLLLQFLAKEGAGAVQLLADINVRRGVGSLASNRRVGPEAAKRIVQYFTSKDSTELIS